jgi:hypothetical protein
MDYQSLYEAEQIRAIAAWKSERPSVLASVVDGLFGRLAHRVTPVVSRESLEKAVAELDVVVSRHRGLAEVAYQAAVSEITELRYSPLKECDALASRISLRVERAAIPRSALLGIDGSAVSRSRLPLPLVAALRVVCRIGHCYGYPLDQPGDRACVLGILEHCRQDAVLTLDAFCLNAVAEAARRVFQERWLIDNGKVESIEPAPPRRRSALLDMPWALSQAAYVGGGVVGFGAAFPILVLGRLLTRGEHACARGTRDGAWDAAHDADQFLAGFLGRDEPAPLTLPLTDRAQALRPMIG